MFSAIEVQHNPSSRLSSYFECTFEIVLLPTLRQDTPARRSDIAVQSLSSLGRHTLLLFLSHQSSDSKWQQCLRSMHRYGFQMAHPNQGNAERKVRCIWPLSEIRKLLVLCLSSQSFLVLA